MSTETIEQKLSKVESELRRYDIELKAAPEISAETKKNIADLEKLIADTNNILSNSPFSFKSAIQSVIASKTKELDTLKEFLASEEQEVIEIENVKRPAALKKRQELLELKAAANKKAKENAAAAGAGKPADGPAKKPDDPDTPATEAKPLLPWWAWLLIAVAVLIFLVAIFAAVARKRQAEENNYAAPSSYPRNPGYAY